MSLMNTTQALLLLDTLCEADTIGSSTETMVEPIISFSLDSIQTTLNETNGILESNNDIPMNIAMHTLFENALHGITGDSVLSQSIQRSSDKSSVPEHGTSSMNITCNRLSEQRNQDDVFMVTNEGSIVDDDTLNNVSTEEEIPVTTNDATTTQDETQQNETIKHVLRSSRKRKKDPENWKRNIRKRRCEHGQEYINSKGIKKPEREIKTTKDCEGKCKFRSSMNITANERHVYFREFWDLSYAEKNVFYSRTTEKNAKERTRSKTNTTRRNFSYRYYFWKGDQRIRVCKEFYLATLDVSQRRIEWFYKNVEEKTNNDKRGTRTESRIPREGLTYVKEHINSFPRIPGHYCRQSSQKEYFEADLNLSKMYRLYQAKCESEGRAPQKEYLYRHIFNNDFNIGLYIPRKDRCDICEEFKARGNNNQTDDNLRAKYENQFDDKMNTKKERDNDRLDKQKLVICFDMQNIMTCPRSNVSNFFYKRKLNVFNLTAHCSLNRKNYNAMWHEGIAGRGGNEIASALVAILDVICV